MIGAPITVDATARLCHGNRGQPNRSRARNDTGNHPQPGQRARRRCPARRTFHRTGIQFRCRAVQINDAARQPCRQRDRARRQCRPDQQVDKGVLGRTQRIDIYAGFTKEPVWIVAPGMRRTDDHAAGPFCRAPHLVAEVIRRRRALDHGPPPVSGRKFCRPAPSLYSRVFLSPTVLKPPGTAYIDPRTEANPALNGADAHGNGRLAQR